MTLLSSFFDIPTLLTHIAHISSDTRSLTKQYPENTMALEHNSTDDLEDNNLTKQLMPMPDTQVDCGEGTSYDEVPVSRSTLLELPPEIRNAFYKFALVEDHYINITPDLTQPALLRTCHFCRTEALRIWYELNHFCIIITDCDTKILEAFDRHLRTVDSDLLRTTHVVALVNRGWMCAPGVVRIGSSSGQS